MEVQYLGCIILSAFLHAFYNILMKKHSGKRYYLAAIYMVAAVCALIITCISGEVKNIPWRSVPYIYGAAFFYSLYQIFVNMAYSEGNLTTSYPLTVLSPLFIPVWAYIFLSERISFLVCLGISTTVIGAIAVQLNSFSILEFKKMFTLNRDYRSSYFAIAASLMYSFGAIFDKSRIASFPVTVYLTLITSFMSINLMIYLSFTKQTKYIGYIRNNRLWVLTGGIVLFFSFLFFRIALQNIDVSIAVPLRQVSVIFAIALGIALLNERIKPARILASLIIIAGVILISIGSKWT